MIKNTLFFTIHNKVQMTLPRVRSIDRETIVYNDNEPTCVQTCDEDTSLFLAKAAHPAKALCWKNGGRKKIFVMLGYHSIQQMLSI